MNHPSVAFPDQPPPQANFKAMPRANRALDVIFCLFALPVLTVIALLMVGFTCLVSRGPVFFRQERVGLRGRTFQMFKFRTMKVDTDPEVHQNHLKQLIESDAPMVKLDSLNDTRLIPGGWILRATGLDELPQLINVLRGEMSLVGPRPCIPGEFEHYLPWQRERVNALPGLTGLWQVSGKNRTTFDEMIKLDIHYARHASLGLNLQIIARTPWAMAVQFHDTRLSRTASAPVPSQIPRTLPAPLPASRVIAA